MHITEKRIEIRAPIERVFDFFSDFESFPRWMKNIKEVRYTGTRFTRWAAEAPLGTEVEWEAETTRFEPDHRISWRSVRGDVETEGEVLFEETRRGTTLLRVVLGYALPAGRFGEMVARLFGKNPEQQLEDDLERFAAVVEGRRRESGREPAREPTADERRRREGRDGHLANERRVARRAFADERDARAGERHFYARRERDYYADAGRPYESEREMPHRERNARAEFDEALRAARRSQLASQRLYAAEREEQRQQLWRDERRERGEGWREAARREAAPFYAEDEERRRPRRYALTPREREREQERRRDPDYDYSEHAFRRGVEKLMDEPPSRRWRRWE